jgi:gliding motility-associated-like protein
VKYFQDNFHHLGTNGYPKLTILPDNTMILSSLFNNSGTNLIKLTSLGDTIWTKTYNSSNPTGANRNPKTLYDVNGNLFSVLNNKYLAELDGSGNVLSTKYVNGLDIYGFGDAAIFPNGDKLILFDVQNGYNYGSILVRVDKSLNTIKWSKLVGGNGLQFSNILIDGNTIVIGGESFLLPYDGSITVSFVCKINGDDGSIIATNSYRDPDSGSGVKFLYKSGNGYIIDGETYYSGNSNVVRPYYIRLTSDLHIQASKRIDELPNVYSGLYYLLPENDGSFYGTYGENFNLTIFKVDGNDSVLWVKRQPDNLSYPGDIAQNEDGIFVTGVENWNNVTTNGAETNFFLSKSDFNGNLISCPSQEQDEIKTIPLPFTESPLIVSSSDFPLTLTDDNTIVSSFPLDLSFPCQAVSPCSSLKLLGDTSVCNNQKVLFTGRKNQSCTNTVQWKLFPEQGYNLEATSDSTISIQFTQSGNYLLKGSLTSCVETQDSINLHVNLVPGINLGPDTVICNDMITLHAGSQFKTYLWQDGSTDSVFKTADPGIFFVQVLDYCENNYTDTVHIGLSNFSLSLPSDTLKCQNDTLQLQAAAGFSNYQWSPSYGIRVNAGGDQASIFVRRDTSYFISAQKWPGCIVRDTIQVKLKTQPFVDLGADTILCDGAVKMLQANNSGASYLWQDGSSDPVFKVDHPGVYSVAIDLNGCSSSDTINIQYQHLPVVYMDKETSLCKGQQLVINPIINNASDYKWQDGTTTLTYIVKDTGLYTISAENICGVTKDSILVHGGVCDIFMPSAFSPNHDGVNDIFRVRYPFPVASFSLNIFNRWGQKIFESRDISKGWDGTFNGQDVTAGGYVWFINVKYEDGRNENLKGTVILIR